MAEDPRRRRPSSPQGHAFIRGTARSEERRRPRSGNIIQDCIKLVFLNQQQLPASAVIEAVVGEIARRNEDLGSAERIATPSPMTIHRRIAEHPFYRTLRLRIGKRAADQMMKPLKVAPEATRPLETIIIDHTKIDDWMLFEDQTSLPCGGRPWLTMAIDAYSRYPVGYYIGFEPPSVYSVMMCLQQAVAPKTDLFAKYKGIKADWRAAGLPLKLVADNAKEVIGLSLPRACAELGIELETSPVRTPKYKGIIERFFRTLNTTFLHRLPGTTYGSPKKLRDSDIDPRKTMSMSFDTFQFLFLKWLTQDYCKAKNRTIGCTPEKRWIEGTEKHRIQMPERISDLKVVLSRHADGMLSRSGIRYQNLAYRNSSTVSSVLEAAGKAKLRVKFRFDPTDIGTIYILHPNGTYLPLHCEDEYAKGISLWQHKIIQDENRKRDRDPKSYKDLMRTRLELMEAVHEAIQTGLAKSYEARFRGIGSQRGSPGSIPVIAIETSSSSVENVITVPTMAAPAFETADTLIIEPGKSATKKQRKKSAADGDPKPLESPVTKSSLAIIAPPAANSSPENDDLDSLLSNRFGSTSRSIGGE